MATISDALKRAIAARKETRYATALHAEINYRTLQRWLDEDADIRLSTVQALADYLGLELKPKSK
jgi:hypothetical protein